jgi:hypothetical protein
MTGNSRRVRNLFERLAADRREARQESRALPRVAMAADVPPTYVRQHKIREAVCELQGSVALAREYRAARRELHRLLGLLN